MLDGAALGKELTDIVREYVAKATAPLIGRIDVLEARQPERGERGEKGEPGERGADGAPGRDGLHGEQGPAGERGERGPAGERGCDGAAGREGAPGKDGLDAVEFIRDDRGHLIATMSNGTTRDLGMVQGAAGKDGADGKDGRDGFGFDDLDLVEEADGVYLRFTRGEVVKAFRLPLVIDRGVFTGKTGYRKGDAVTWAGSLWIAQKDEPGKPDTPDSGWRLAVKRGRDGRDGRDGKPGDRGPQGDKGDRGDQGPRGFGG